MNFFQWLMQLLPWRCRSCGIAGRRREATQPVDGQCCVCHQFDAARPPARGTMPQPPDAGPSTLMAPRWGGPTQPLVSPWAVSFTDTNHASLGITVRFDNDTMAITDATVTRDAGCLYRVILLGVGADGIPDSTPHAFVVPFGTSVITAGQLSRNGLSTINDVLALSVTAGF